MKNYRSNWKWLTVIAALLLLLAACGGDEEPTPTTAPVATVEPAEATAVEFGNSQHLHGPQPVQEEARRADEERGVPEEASGVRVGFGTRPGRTERMRGIGRAGL